MEKFMLVEEVSEPRSFEVTRTDGSKTNVQCVTLVLYDARNRIAADAFDKVAQSLVEEGVKAGSSLLVDLSFGVRTQNTDKGKFTRNDVRLAGYKIVSKEPMIVAF